MNLSSFFSSLVVITFQTICDAETFNDAQSNGYQDRFAPSYNSRDASLIGPSSFNNNSPFQKRPSIFDTANPSYTNPPFSTFPKRTFGPTSYPQPAFRNNHITSTSFGGTAAYNDNFHTFASSPLFRQPLNMDRVGDSSSIGDSLSISDSSSDGDLPYRKTNSMMTPSSPLRKPVFIPSRTYLLSTSSISSGNIFPSASSYPFNSSPFPKPIGLPAVVPYRKPIAIPIATSSDSSDDSDADNNKPSLSLGDTATAAAAGAAVATAVTKPTQPSPGAVAGAAGMTNPMQPPIIPPPEHAAVNPEKGEQPWQREDKCNWCIRKNCSPGGCMEVPNFNPKKDAEALHDALLAKDEKVAIDILTHRSDGQIKKIKQEYQGYASALSTDVAKSKFETKGLLLALLKPRATYFAEELHKALDKSDEETMIMILTSLSPCAIKKVGVAYNHRYGEMTSLAGDIKDASYRNFEAFLKELSRGNRAPDGPVDKAEAEKDAKALYKAGPSTWFVSDKSVFIDIFTHRSYSQLKQIIETYNEMRKPNSDILKDIRANTRDKLKKGLTVMMKNVEDQPGYFANELEGSMDKFIGSGVKDMDKLIRIMRGRCGIDLGDIRDAYPNNHSGKVLSDRLAKKKRVKYIDALLAMLQEPQTQDTSRTP